MNDKKKIGRNDEITAEYFSLLERHLADLVAGRATEMLQLGEIARELHVSARHLSDTIRLTMGQHPCFFYDRKILDEAKKLLTGTDLPVAEIARMLTYDPSNFSKFFKKYNSITPAQFRIQQKK